MLLSLVVPALIALDTRPKLRRQQSFGTTGNNIGDGKPQGGGIFQRYPALARETAIGGDPIAAENLYQHAEHYFRIGNASRDGYPHGRCSRPRRPMPR